MIRRTAFKIILPLWRFKQRFEKKTALIDIARHLSTVKCVLVYMPGALDYFEPAAKYVRQIKSHFPDWRLTLLVRKETAKLLDNRIKAEVISYSDQDFNLIGLPRATLAKQCKNDSFDLMLDFTFHCDFFGAYLLKYSRAALKVCFGCQEKTPFCNFEIRTNPLESIESKYKTLTKYVTICAEAGSHARKAKRVDVKI